MSPLFLTTQEQRHSQNTATYQSNSSRGIVLDVLQTELEYLEKENKHVRRQLEETRKEKDDEAELFQLKVKELQEQFSQVEKKIKEKDYKQENGSLEAQNLTLTKMNILKQENKYLGQELYKKCQQLEALQEHLNIEQIDSESMYESLNFDKDSVKKKKSCCKQFSTFLQCSIVILFSVGLIVVLAVVLPMKIIFGSQS